MKHRLEYWLGPAAGPPPARFLASTFLMMAISATTIFAQGPTAASVDFTHDVRPILAKHCFSCHGPDVAEAGLALHEKEQAFALLDSGEHAIVAGKPEVSGLIQRITATDESIRMPLEKKPLSNEEIATLKRWISEGANWSKHWAFVPVKEPSVPEVKDAGWARNAVDRFILAGLERRGLKPAPEADRVTLIRRVYQDVIGLPPTPDEVRDFVQDPTSDAYERLVDKLLATPGYGERWGRHWLDLVRYAETNSFERDGPKPNAWRYRDYVIRSFNADKPYDRFILEQLAGDELPDASAETIIATGYYRLGLWDDEPADRLQARYDELDDIVATTAQVFLGLTINCSRCHDHKIDPIPQKNYYQLLAFFQGVPSYGTRPDQISFNQTDISPPDVVEAYAKLESLLRSVKEQMLKLENKGIVLMDGPDQRRSETSERQQLLDEKLSRYLDETDWATYTQLKNQKESLEKQLAALPERTMALSVNRCDPAPPPTRILLRGNPHVPGEVVSPGYPDIFGTAPPEIPPAPPGAKTSGRRTVVAKWIASPDNMLTARVMVNRIWQHHFGRGIVRSPNNFGQMGDPPTHPELLDWLATQFVQNGWKLKPMHRLMLLSSTYRMTSQADHASEIDPTNDLFWRFNLRRMSAEELRDTVHAVSGELNLQMYGPSIYPEISAEVLHGQSQPGKGWGKSSRSEQARRSIYIHVKRSLITPILSSFDFPETDSSCEARFSTTQPTQALAMLNGPFLNQQSQRFAERLQREAGTDARKRVERALWLTTCRQPTENEILRGIKLIESLQRDHGLDDATALRYFCLTMLNLNEFVYID